MRLEQELVNGQEEGAGAMGRWRFDAALRGADGRLDGEDRKGR